MLTAFQTLMTLTLHMDNTEDENLSDEVVRENQSTEETTEKLADSNQTKAESEPSQETTETDQDTETQTEGSDEADDKSLAEGDSPETQKKQGESDAGEAETPIETSGTLAEVEGEAEKEAEVESPAADEDAEVTAEPEAETEQDAPPDAAEVEGTDAAEAEAEPPAADEDAEIAEPEAEVEQEVPADAAEVEGADEAEAEAEPPAADEAAQVAAEPEAAAEQEAPFDEAEVEGADEAEAEVEPPAADESDEVEAGPEAETEEAPAPDESEEVVEMALGLGVIDEVYNFVSEFRTSQISNVEEASAGTQDSAGGVKKAALFEHPRAEGEARIEYELTLPQLASNEKLFLHFSIGLRDGIDFDYPLTKPDGVRFAIEISGERRFEDFSIACQWDEHVIDLSDDADRQIQVAFLTDCNGGGNTNFDWALWGNPRLLKVTRVSLPIKVGEAESKMMGGLAIGLLDGEFPELSASEFALDAYIPASEIADEISGRMARDKTDKPIVELTLYAEQPQLEIVTVGPTSALIPAGEDFELQCTVRNNGLVPLATINQANVSLNRIKLRRGRHTQALKTLNSGEETTFVWQIRSFSRQTVTSISVSLRYQTPTGEIRQKVEIDIEIRPAIPKLSAQISRELNTREWDGHVVTENRNLRAFFVRGREGFEYYVLFAAKGGYYRQIAVSNAISEIRYRDAQGNIQQARITPSTYRLAGNNQGESIVLLSCEVQDADGVRWSYEGRFSLSEDSKHLKTEHRLVTDGKRELIVFRGPMLYAGDWTFGENKTFALFPGLEFLENGECSSNTRDAEAPLNNRLVPHPYKITIPLMAVEHKKSLVGLVWNPLETWDGEHNMLSAVFASPNGYNHQKNHLMGLFLPTSPDWVDENSLEASTPYVLEANCPITLKAQIILDGNASILEATSLWTDAYGMPEPLEAPRSDEEELLLSRHGFMHTVWDEERGKSRHCVDQAPGNAPGFATLLWYDYLVQTQDHTVKDESVKQRVFEIAQNTIRESGAGSLISPALCHILKWEFPFYYGHVEAGLDRLKAVMRGLMETQESDGSWGFHPTTDRTKTLGKEGDVVLGTCAHSALMLLKHARITGDEETLAAGLKALRFMERFKVPRGAQAWECPLYEPDLLASTYAVGAYVEAYEIAGENRYLVHAEYWAEAGLPFLYFWNLPDRPGMRFASIPVFGTTFHTQPWFGVPVQWNGLVFAYYLQHLARHSNRRPWVQIADGITVSAMYQQWTEGELKGTYPDGFYSFCTEGRGAHINPEDIMMNLYALRGLDPDISTAIIRHESGRVHLSTGAKIESVARDDSGKLDFKLKYVQHETCYTIITGYGGKFRFAESSAEPAPRPAVVRDRNGEITSVDNLESVESGWLYREEKDIIFIKYKHPTGEIDFQVLPSAEEGAEAEGASQSVSPIPEDQE